METKNDLLVIAPLHMSSKSSLFFNPPRFDLILCTISSAFLVAFIEQLVHPLYPSGKSALPFLCRINSSSFSLFGVFVFSYANIALSLFLQYYNQPLNLLRLIFFRSIYALCDHLSFHINFKVIFQILSRILLGF